MKGIDEAHSKFLHKAREEAIELILALPELSMSSARKVAYNVISKYRIADEDYIFEEEDLVHEALGRIARQLGLSDKELAPFRSGWRCYFYPEALAGARKIWVKRGYGAAWYLGKLMAEKYPEMP